MSAYRPVGLAPGVGGVFMRCYNAAMKAFRSGPVDHALIAMIATFIFWRLWTIIRRRATGS